MARNDTGSPDPIGNPNASAGLPHDTRDPHRGGGASNVGGGGGGGGGANSGGGGGTRGPARPKRLPYGKRPGQGTAAEATKRDPAFAIVMKELEQYGLGSIAEWAWDRFQRTQSMDLLMLEMRQRDEYKQRFPYLEALRQSGHAMTEQEAVAYETSAIQIMRSAGMPSGFYDKPDDFSNLITNQVSVAELQSRVQDAYVRVAGADPSVRKAFGTYYGVNGDKALAAFFLDPDKATPVLQRQVAAAEFGGMSQQFGFDVNKVVAEKIGNSVTDAAQRSGLLDLAQRQDLFTEQVGDTADLAAGDAGVAATFGTDPNAIRDVQQRQRNRAAQGAGSDQGGATTLQTGVALGGGSGS